jgi:hypothetical protein
MRKIVLKACLFVKGRNLAYLVFGRYCKNKCAKLGIAKTGFQNPKRGEESKN